MNEVFYIFYLYQQLLPALETQPAKCFLCSPLLIQLFFSLGFSISFLKPAVNNCSFNIDFSSIQSKLQLSQKFFPESIDINLLSVPSFNLLNLQSSSFSCCQRGQNRTKQEEQYCPIYPLSGCSQGGRVCITVKGEKVGVTDMGKAEQDLIEPFFF